MLICRAPPTPPPAKPPRRAKYSAFPSNTFDKIAATELSVAMTTASLSPMLRAVGGIVACSDFRPGDTIQIWTGCYWHLGIYVGNDKVIHAVKLYRSEYVFQVVRTSLRDFAGDNVVYINNAIASNDRAAVCRRARATVGRKYNFLIDNCEHFAREMHGLEKECGQFREIWECIKAVGLINAETIKTLSPKGVLMFGVLQLVFGYTDWASGQNRIASGD